MKWNVVLIFAIIFFANSCKEEPAEDIYGEKSDNDFEQNDIEVENDVKDDKDLDNFEDGDFVDTGDDDSNGEINDIGDSGICTPGETKECYDGPSNSKGVGLCRAGLLTCVVDGTGWSDCVGQILPTVEICGDAVDQNCDGEDTSEYNVIDIDGDGYNYCNGDCCETSWDCAGEPSKINPGAYEIDEHTDGNTIDENCNGDINECGPYGWDSYEWTIADDDGDGIINSVECTACPCIDSDGDDLLNYMDHDSDADGLTDTKECPAQPCKDTDNDKTPDYLDQDSDNDGLTDKKEKEQATNPYDSDTDDDGDSDFDEIEFGSDPLDPESSIP